MYCSWSAGIQPVNGNPSELLRIQLPSCRGTIQVLQARSCALRHMRRRRKRLADGHADRDLMLHMEHRLAAETTVPGVGISPFLEIAGFLRRSHFIELRYGCLLRFLTRPLFRRCYRSTQSTASRAPEAELSAKPLRSTRRHRPRRSSFLAAPPLR